MQCDGEMQPPRSMGHSVSVRNREPPQMWLGRAETHPDHCTREPAMGDKPCISTDALPTYAFSSENHGNRWQLYVHTAMHSGLAVVCLHQKEMPVTCDTAALGEYGLDANGKSWVQGADNLK